VAKRLGLASTLPGWRVEGSVLPNTNMIRIDAEGPEAGRAAEVANVAAEITSHEARSLYRIFTMKWLSTASVPSRPSEPDLRRNLLVAAAIGMLLGVLGAIGLRRFRPHPSRS
jgi:capsular polysaccharide biosynthesis protein